MNTNLPNPSTSAPSSGAIAYHLSALAHLLPGPNNADRDRLRRIAHLVTCGSPAGQAAAYSVAVQASEHVGQPNDTEDRPEIWLLCAVAAVLCQPGLLAGWVRFTAGHQSEWVQLVAELAYESTGERVHPAIGSAEAWIRRGQLHGLGEWLRLLQALSGAAAVEADNPGGAERPGLLVVAPKADEVDAWFALLGAVADELNTSKPAALAGDQRAARLAQLQSMRLWLVGLASMHARTALGEVVSNDPDAMPLY